MQERALQIRLGAQMIILESLKMKKNVIA